MRVSIQNSEMGGDTSLQPPPKFELRVARGRRVDKIRNMINKIEQNVTKIMTRAWNRNSEMGEGIHVYSLPKFGLHVAW